MFGTKMTDEFFPVHTGGDIAFVNGVLKQLLAIGGVDRAVRDRAHDRVRRAARRARGRAVRRPRTAVGRDAAPTWRASRACTPSAESRRARVVDGHHPARARRRQRARDRQPRARARQRRPRRARGSCRSAATRACRAAPRWAATRPRSPAASPIDARRTRPRSPREWGFAVPADARARPRPRWSTRRAAASSTCCGRAAATSSTCCPRPTSRATALARTPLRVHQDIVRDAPDARRPGRDRRAAARGDALRAGGRRHLDHDRAARRVQPRDPGPARRRGAQRVADLRRRRAPRAPRARRPRSAARRPTRSAPRSRASCPRYAGIERLRETGDAIQVGGAHLCEGGVFPTPDGTRALRASSRRTTPTCPTGSSCCRPGAASSSTRWCGPTSIRSPARHATRCSSPTADAAALGVARRATRCSCARAHGEMRARVHLAPIRPGNVQAFFPEANVLLAADARATRSRACPTTTRSSRWSRSDDARRRCSNCSTRPRSRSATRCVRDRRRTRRRDRTDAPGPVRARPRRRRGRAARSSASCRCAS